MILVEAQRDRELTHHRQEVCRYRAVRQPGRTDNWTFDGQGERPDQQTEPSAQHCAADGGRAGRCVINSRPCPTAADRQLACFTVELRNIGQRLGTGTCVVTHYVRGSGEALVGEGPSFQARLRPGEVLRAEGQAHLTAPFTVLRFTSYCDPGGGLA